MQFLEVTAATMFRPLPRMAQSFRPLPEAVSDCLSIDPHRKQISSAVSPPLLRERGSATQTEATTSFSLKVTRGTLDETSAKTPLPSSRETGGSMTRPWGSTVSVELYFRRSIFLAALNSSVTMR